MRKEKKKKKKISSQVLNEIIICPQVSEQLFVGIRVNMGPLPGGSHIKGRSPSNDELSDFSF
jgi:hypothetical protein